MERLLERDRIEALDFERVRPRTRLRLRLGLGLRLCERALPLRPLETERSPSASVSILLSLVFFPLAEDVMDRGLGDRPREDILKLADLAAGFSRGRCS